MPSFLKRAFYKSLRNLGSRSKIITLKIPQSAISSLSRSNSAQSAALKVDFPNIKMTLEIAL